MGANDPQIQMAEDTAWALVSNQTVEILLPSDKVDMKVSLAPYIIVFDADGKPTASNVLLCYRNWF